MVAKTSTNICSVCNNIGSIQCSRCGDAHYCSSECQRADFAVHKLVCKQFTTFPSSSRPGDNYFRVMIFPHLDMNPELCCALQPELAWASTKDSDKLVVGHSIISKWKQDMEGRYKMSEEDPLVIQALSRDSSMKGKTFGHGLRIASWQPPPEATSHLGGFNETVISLSSAYVDRKYGPLVAFAYRLDADFEYKDMDDITTNDLRHLVDFFNNSDWNPSIGDGNRYPGKTLKSILLTDSLSYKGLSTVDPDKEKALVSQTISANINFKQTCLHRLCNPHLSPISEICPGGHMWHAFLLGPLLLGLPWIGRNVVMNDTHGGKHRRVWPLSRWDSENFRFLRQGVRIGRGVLTIDALKMSDGLTVFNAFGQEVHQFHLLAYNMFMKYKLTGGTLDLTTTTGAEFSKFWQVFKEECSELKEGGADRLADFTTGIPSPCETIVKTQTVLSRDVERAFRYLRGLFQDERFRNHIRRYEKDYSFQTTPQKSLWDIPEELWQDSLGDVLFELWDGR
ncbi:hypothetical protein FDECE_1520 [Fusarium decemcellulare]|nr:hypothetical protein FDECE_1520 [Fusarium decemcellulare]